MRWLVLVMAACSASAPLELTAPVALGEPEPFNKLVIPAAAPRPPEPIVTGIPGASIESFAATSDARAVVTSSGSLRLWPVLDGTREPVVIAARGRTAGLAIERVGNGFSIARLDDTGTLEVIQTTEAGAIESRTPVASERALERVWFAGEIALALTDDGAVVRIAKGRITGRLVPPPGERITTLLVRRGRALALVASPTGSRGRWIGEPFGWAGETAALDVTHEQVALSADHRLLATTVRKSHSVVILELATGKRVRTVTSVHREMFAELTIAGFLEDGSLGVATGGMLDLWRDGKKTTNLTTHGFFVRPVATDRGFISTYDHQLAITEGTKTHYLGYHISGPTIMRPTPAGLLVATPNQLYRLDDQLAIRERYKLSGKQLGDPYAAIPVDDERALVSTGLGVGLYEIATGKRVQKLSDAGYADYHPVTRLVSIQGHQTMQVGFYQPRAKRVGRLVPVPLEEGVDSSLTLLDPAVSRGHVAAVVEQVFSRFETLVTIREIRAVRPAAEEPIVFGATRTIENNFETLGFRTSARRKRSDGHEVVLDNHRIKLLDPSGAERWTIPAGEIVDVAWLPSDELVVVGGGVGVLDVATGAFVRRQCGWDFRLADEPSTDSHGRATLCSRE